MELRNAVAVVTGANRGLGRISPRSSSNGGEGVRGGPPPRDGGPAGRRPAPAGRDGRGIGPGRRRPRPGRDPADQQRRDLHLHPLIAGHTDAVRQEMETNYFGPLAVTRAFAPVIAGNGGGAVLNVLSVLSWLHPAELGSYAATKAAAWALTRAVREELAPRGIAVSALHVAYMDTDMAAAYPPTARPTRRTSPRRHSTASRRGCPRSSPTRSPGTSRRACRPPGSPRRGSR